MKTSLKRFFAGVAAAAMAVGGLALGATSAQAAGPVASTQKGSLTVNAANGTAGHALKAYLVAAYNSDYHAASDGSLDFDTFKYVVTKDNGTTSNDESAVEAALKDAGVTAKASGSASAAEEGLKQLKGQSAGTPFGYADSAKERLFADSLAKRLTATDSTKWTPSNAQDLTAGDGKFTADLDPEGLYLVVDTYTQQDGSNSTQSVPMLVGTKFANAAVTTQPAGVGEIDMKNTTIPVHKEVVTDDTGANANNTPSYNIGDTVYFHLSTKIPDYSGYEADATVIGKNTRLLNLVDEFEAGKFTDTKVVSVKDSTTSIGDLKDGTDYDVTGEGTNTLTVDLKKLVNGYAGAKTGWKTGDVIDVVVSGVLSANATTTNTVNNADDKTGADSNGNSNKVTLNYSNNPKDNSRANKVPGDTVNVYSFNLNVNKVDQDNKPLGGAEFKIYSKTGDTVSMTPLQFTVSGSTYTHAKAGTVGATDTLVSAATSGAINVKGLKAGTYVVTETKAPAGFFQGALPSYTVEIAEDYTNDESNKTRASMSGDDWLTTLTYSYVQDANKLVTKDTSSTDAPNTSTATVKNVKSITQLPKTGAAGIAFFSIIGVAIVAMAALFAVRARKASRLA
ncbi:MAG: SpaA isopeptide-forming pilin-related protein [Bifidobacterium sp.]|nr:SpaA isopeptide-forming pilin-related protein [Bifidobacterium sp.]